MPPIPETPRVFYAKNPLEEVLCQLRFPAILRIDTEPPARFQERLRPAFPVLKESGVAQADVPIPAEVIRFMGLSGGAVFNFTSQDENWTAGLSRDFLALSARKYESWELFKRQLDAPLAALLEEYRPAFFTRVGLRYRDVIRRSVLGLDGVPWSKLLKPHVAAELASGAEDEIEQVAHQFDMRIAGGRVRVQHGLGKDPGGEIVYVIDADYFNSERTETGNAIRTLDNFNRIAGHLFRWCIADRLDAAMEPGPDARPRG